MQPFVKTYKKGITLFHENDHTRELYLIQSGSVKVYRKISNREIELAVLKKGAVLGEMALIDGKPRSASAVACDDCSVILIDADTFHDKISGVPQWFMSVIRTTSEKIRKANSRLESAYQQSHGLHIILALKYFFARSSASIDGKKSLDSKLALRQLTQFLCTTHQRIMTVLEFLQKSGLVEIKDNHLLLQSSTGMDDYCLFLRLLGRKAFDKIGVVTQQSKKVMTCLREQMTIGGNVTSEKQKTMTGEELFSILAKCGVDKNCMEIVGELKDLGIMGVSKPPGLQPNEQPKDQPLAGCQVTIDSDVFEKYYLFCTFNSMVPVL
jgi:cAMP-binding proteins - catabolite gene activator and regulatory subunit of cAMP-dependent protein kinases